MAGLWKVPVVFQTPSVIAGLGAIARDQLLLLELPKLQFVNLILTTGLNLQV